MKRKDTAISVCLFFGTLLFWYGIVTMTGVTSSSLQRVQELEAAERMRTAMDAIREETAHRGIPSAPATDPNDSGLIGADYSAITTTLGSLPAKRTGAQPDAAALMVRLLSRSGVGPDDVVALDSSGSFPGFAVATLVAAEELGADVRYILSLGASTYGANRPDLTIADIAAVLVASGIIRRGPVAVSAGGADDMGSDIAGEELDAASSRAIAQGATFIAEPNAEANIALRRRILDGAGTPKVFVSVGGNWVSTGPKEQPVGSNGLLLPADADRFAGTGMVQSYLRDGVKVIRIIDVADLCAKTSLPFDPIPWPGPGRSSFYRGRRGDRFFILLGPVLAVLFVLAFRLLRHRDRPLSPPKT